MKDLNLDPKELGVISHFHSMLFRLTGAGLVKGRHHTAIEVWRKIEANRDAIAKKAKERGATKKNGITIRGQVAKEMFDALDGAKEGIYGPCRGGKQGFGRDLGKEYEGTSIDNTYRSPKVHSVALFMVPADA